MSKQNSVVSQPAPTAAQIAEALALMASLRAQSAAAPVQSARVEQAPAVVAAQDVAVKTPEPLVVGAGWMATHPLVLDPLTGKTALVDGKRTKVRDLNVISGARLDLIPDGNGSYMSLAEARARHGRDGLGVHLAGQAPAMAAASLAFVSGMVASGTFISGVRRSRPTKTGQAGRLTSISLVHVPSAASQSLAIKNAPALTV